MAKKVAKFRPKHDPKDDDWVREHFEELVDKYAGKYVAVVNQEVVGVDKSALEAEKKALKKYPNRIPSVLRVPHPEDFACAL